MFAVSCLMKIEICDIYVIYYMMYGSDIKSSSTVL
jgi:hypothetical protein